MRGNIISFQVYIDSKGNLMTEYSRLPDEALKIFDTEDKPYIKKVLNEASVKLEGLHAYLEKELQAL